MKNLIMIGPHGERDYIEEILQGCPYTCGDHPEDALNFSNKEAENWQRFFKKHWLSVVIEDAQQKKTQHIV